MLHPLLLHNGEIKAAGEMCLQPGQDGLLAGWGVFSTIKVAAGVLFEFERHWARLNRDADSLRVPFPWDIESLRSLLLELVEANRAYDATLRIVVVRNAGTMWAGANSCGPADLLAFTASRRQWGASARLGVVANARHAGSQFAGSKTTSWAHNLVWLEEAHLRGFDEVVLLNERGEVSECTSANIFAAFGAEVLTPPLSSGCLPGVTRDLLLETIQVPSCRVREATLLLEDLERADGIFITSTTRDLLPVSQIEGLSIGQNHAARNALMDAFALHQTGYCGKLNQMKGTQV
ncbi:MAG: aminotransferase class IV family protein [Acidobacteria bacterium]|nr:aminotransferase class IV family protein [Acidobacteriota bacterium]